VSTIFLTHTPDMLANYYGARALTALRARAPVRLNETGAVLDAATLAREANGCEIVISDRQTAAPLDA
jgi:D-3-phosphoglycerate dehydrogenase